MSVAQTPPDQPPQILTPALTQEERRRLSQNRANRGYIIYPNDMDDSQDRVKFELYQINKLTFNSSEVGGTALPTGSGTANEEKKLYSKVGAGGPALQTIFLPIQSGISDTNAVNWSGQELNEVQKRLAQFSLGAMAGGGYKEVTNQLEQLATGMLKDKGFGNFVRLSFAEQALGIQGLLSRATGTVLNPNLELLFQGPTLRPFQFQFKLSPRNSIEAEEVKEIIKFFKQNMAVKRDGGLFLKAPYIFKIQYQKGAGGDTAHPSIGKIKPCALQSCSVDYTPLGSYMTYNDSDATMVSYNISLQFQEIVPIYHDDYDNLSIGY